jgi:hypothetical protein
MTLSIRYNNSRAPVPVPDRYSTYDLESAFYDYEPAGISATVQLDGYSLDLEIFLAFVHLVRSSLEILEALLTRPVHPTLRELAAGYQEIPDQCTGTFWIVPEFRYNVPALVFIKHGDMVSIYTRTSTRDGLKVLPERDLAEPVSVPYRDLVEEITRFMSQYLDDIAAAFPFLGSDDLYHQYRRRVAVLRENVGLGAQ